MFLCEKFRIYTILQLIAITSVCFSYLIQRNTRSTEYINKNYYQTRNFGFSPYPNRHSIIFSTPSDSSNQNSLNGLIKCLQREYATFFKPMDKRFYRSDVTFDDPLNSFSGVDNYQNNVDLLGGRTSLGKLLFRDASIVLHNVEILSATTLQTRWTLQLTVNILPWKPRPRFTGISVYTLDKDGKVANQVDYWDSINLKNGKYVKVSRQDGISDFLSQLKNDEGAQMAAQELPVSRACYCYSSIQPTNASSKYELLRRAPRYEVRRYPAYVSAETLYSSRPEGYDRIASYCGGSNVNENKIGYFAPTIMKIIGDGDTREKYMSWPLQFVAPGQSLDDLPEPPKPTIPKLNIRRIPEKVYAVTRFEVAATEPVVKGYTSQLLNDIRNDGLIAVSTTPMEYTVGQFDALFSLNKRRIEVWVELSSHPWVKS